jgi:aminopeptidase-like protein
LTEHNVSTSEIASYANRLFPIARSLTGEGNRLTLSILKEICDLTVHEIPSGQEVFDWSVPQEWLVREAWIADSLGRKIVDFGVNALHLVGYSVATDREMSWEELEPHVYRHEFLPNAIPHRTSYYKKGWGFCVTQEQFVALSAEPGRLHVRIDADHFDGSMSYGELVIPGESDRELLISSYICHPYMANDCLSGFLIAALLARHIAQLPSRKWSYRFIFIPETVGAIAYSALHEEEIREVSAALVITTAGGPGKFGLKKTWDEGHWLNGLIEDSLTSLSKDFVSSPFSIRGSDERQYSSPGLRINTATVSKDRYHEYPEYHTSLDNLELVTPEQLRETLEVYVDVIDRIEKLAFYRNLEPNGEPMLSKHGLYPTLGGSKVPKAGDTSDLDLMLWLLFYSDGKTPLSHIAKKLGVEDKAFDEPIRALMDSGLLGKD